MTTLEVDGFGRVVPESLTRALAAHPNLVSLQYANNEVGVVQNIPALAALCREADVLLHVDAVQAAGHLAIPLDGIDFLSASAHKFGGPKGIGFLYVREPRKLRPLIYGGSQQYGLRPGTEPAAADCGLGRSVQGHLRRAPASALPKSVPWPRSFGRHCMLPGPKHGCTPLRTACRAC